MGVDSECTHQNTSGMDPFLYHTIHLDILPSHAGVIIKYIFMIQTCNKQISQLH
jgi:hypothetical protein